MSSKKKRKGHEEEHAGNHERWMISYADMLTLLLALFIVMFAISKVDQAKFIEFAQGASTAFGGQGPQALTGKTGINDGQNGITQGLKPATDMSNSQDLLDAGKALLQQKQAAEKERQNLEALKKQISEELGVKGLRDFVRMSVDPERGLVVNIVTDKVLFDSGQATLRPQGALVLDLIAPSVVKLPNKVIVEGHTDNVPINTAQFPSNWELSTSRATTVLRRLTTAGLPESRVSASGYADTHPLDTNATDAGRQLNRRVAIVVLPNVQNPSIPVASPAAGATH